MKIKRIVSVTLISALFLLCACSSGGGEKKSSSKSSEESIIRIQSEPETEEETVPLIGEENLKKALRQRLERCIGIEGSAGASLKALHQSVQLLKLTRDGDYSLNIVSPVVLEFFTSLSPEDQRDFVKTWGSIDYYTDTILNDFYSISVMLEDTGDLEVGKELSYDDIMKGKWTIVRQGMIGVLPKLEDLPGENGEAEGTESGSKDRRNTLWEADVNGNVILKEIGEDGEIRIVETDVYGKILETEDPDSDLDSEGEEDNEEVVETAEESHEEETSEPAASEAVTAPFINYPTRGVVEQPVTTAAVTIAPSAAYPATVPFTNVIIVSVDEKLDPSELGALTSKYNMRLIYDYQNMDMYAFSCENVSNQEQMDFIMSMLKSENHITSVTQDRTLQLH